MKRAACMLWALPALLLASCSDREARKDAREALKQGDGERAARFFSLALDREPGDARLRRGLAEAWILVARERTEDGEDKPADWARPVRELERIPQDSTVARLLDESRLGRARSLARSGDTSRALLVLERALESNPRATASRNLLAVLVDRRGEHDRAAELFLQNTVIDSADVDSWFNLALVEWARGHRLEAAEHILRASRLNPKDPEILWWLGRIADMGDDRK